MTIRRRVIIHVGQTKAGSTSIQNYMENEHDRLLQRGWLFPRSVMLRQNPFDRKRTPGHLRLLTDLSSDKTAEFKAELEANPTATVVISIENLFSDQPDKSLALLGGFFNSWDVEIMAVLRPQLDWLRSRYVENVLSGFRFSTAKFDTYVREAADSGALNYHGRLAHLQKILGARKVTAIRLEDETGPLLRRFLKALNVPETGSVASEKIHENRRGKEVFLIEAKRRLNSLIEMLTVTQRLDLEHQLRQRAKQMKSEVDFVGGGQLTTRFPLTNTELEALQSSNDALLSAGILDSRLTYGQQGEVDSAPDVEAAAATRQLFAEGITMAARIAADTQDPDRFLQSPLRLCPAATSHLLEVLAENRISLHINAPESATLAACEDGGLAALMLPPSSAAYNLFAQLDATETASPLVTLPVDSEQVDDMRACLRGLRLPHPGVIVFGNGMSSARICTVLRQISPLAAVFLGNVREVYFEYPLSDYRALPICDCLFLSRRDCKTAR